MLNVTGCPALLFIVAYHPCSRPNDDLPEMEPAFKALGQMIVSTGLEVARHCDNYVKSICPAYENGKLESIIRESKCCKGRLLHYYSNDDTDVNSKEELLSNNEICEIECTPRILDNSNRIDSDQPCEHPAEQSSSGSTTDQEFSSWCGWHNDHGSLTGLTAAMLLDKDGHVVTDPDPLSGTVISIAAHKVL